MYRVALVDDELFVVEQLESMIKEYSTDSGNELLIEKFNSGTHLINSGFANFDIIFLDIEMPMMNGLETAKKIRETNTKSLIIFCTNLAQYAINGYEVDALGYLLKPIQKFSLMQNLKKACALLNKRKSDKITIKTVHGQVLLNVSDIVYVEVQKHNLFFYMLQKNAIEFIRTRGSMQETSAILKNSNFVRCSTCYLVNLKYISSIENGIVNLPSTNLPISRLFKKEFSEAFMKFLVENGVENI